MKFKEILEKLPASWDELKLKDYIKLAPAINDDEQAIDPDIITSQILTQLDKNILIISLLTGIGKPVIEDLKMTELSALVDKISFLNQAPEPAKSSIRFKRFNELTYDNFITFQKLSLDFTEDKILSSAIANLPMMLAVFANDKDHNEDYFLTQPMPEVIDAFFTVTQNIRKFLRTSQRSSFRNLMKIQSQMFKNLLTLSLKKLNPLKKSLTRIGTTL